MNLSCRQITTPYLKTSPTTMPYLARRLKHDSLFGNGADHNSLFDKETCHNSFDKGTGHNLQYSQKITNLRLIHKNKIK